MFLIKTFNKFVISGELEALNLNMNKLSNCTELAYKEIGNLLKLEL